jgi:hypothetical protein
MAKPKKAASAGGGNGGEVQVSKSPAEFFAENQAIAGFDNMGKSLYTSIRECECMKQNKCILMLRCCERYLVLTLLLLCQCVY